MNESIRIQDVRIVSDVDARHEIEGYIKSNDRWVSVVEIVEHTTLSFEQVNRLVKAL